MSFWAQPDVVLRSSSKYPLDVCRVMWFPDNMFQGGLLLCREHASGISEIIKYGLIRDAELFSWLEENMQALLDKDSKADPSPSLPLQAREC